MRRLAVFIQMSALWLYAAGGTIVRDTTWGPGSMEVTDTVWVDSGAVLTIAAGTRVSFGAGLPLKVRGRVLAQGNEFVIIIFTASDSTTGWGGIRFENPPHASDTSLFIHCRIEYARNAIASGQAAWGAGLYLQTPAKARIEHCEIRRNSGSSYGGGVYVSSSGVTLRDNVISGNSAAAGAGVCAYGGRPIISGNRIEGNAASAVGGGIYCAYCSPVLVNNAVTGNSAGNGGGVSLSVAPVSLVNCLVAENTAVNLGGGIYCPDSLLRLINCTVVRNTAGLSAGGLCASTTNPAASPVLVSCIFWGNAANGTPNQVSLNNPTVQPEIRNCDIQGGLAVIAGNGVPRVYRDNFDLDPLFADSAAGDYSIGPVSPCINTGAPDTTGLGLPALDLTGNARIYAGAFSRIDVGAYEAAADPASAVTVTTPGGGDSLMVGSLCRIAWTTTGSVGSVRIEYCTDSGRTWIAIAASVSNTGVYDWTVPGAVSPGCVVRLSEVLTGAPFDEGDGLFTIFDSTRICGWITENTVWDADTVRVGCPVYVDTGVTLTINPGTHVEFLGAYPLKIRGRLLAQGLVTDSIVFTALDTVSGWRGIRFDSLSSTLNDTSKLEFCRIQYARTFSGGLEGYGGAVFINSFRKVVISKSTLDNNVAINGGAGVCLWMASAVINGNTIRNNATTASIAFGGGVFCNASDAAITGNIIRYNRSSLDGGGISIQGGSPRIMNNRIEFNTAGNEGGGIRCNQGASPLIIGCLIRGNTAYDGGGVFANGSNPTFRNSTVANNRASIGPGLKLETSSAQVRNSIIWNNGISTSGSTLNAEYSCLPAGYTGTATLSVDPLFADSASGNFQLADGSPCINAGNPDTAGLGLPELDLAGNPRLFGIRVDMGAYENQGVTGAEMNPMPAGTPFLHNSPNPFKTTTRISFSASMENARVEVFDVRGRRVRCVEGVKGTGFTLEMDDLNSGVYLARVLYGPERLEKIITLLK